MCHIGGGTELKANWGMPGDRNRKSPLQKVTHIERDRKDRGRGGVDNHANRLGFQGGGGRTSIATSGWGEQSRSWMEDQSGGGRETVNESNRVRAGETGKKSVQVVGKQ